MAWMDIFQEVWAIRALLASMMVGIMCGILGCFIVLRNMALIGDALSHAILPGIVVSFILFGYSTVGFFVGSVIAGLLTAIGITWIQQHIHTKNDAAIGIVFTAMFSLGVIGISWISKEQGVHLDLKDFLFGNVLGVSNEDLYLTLGITVYVIASVIIFYRYLFISTFQPVIAQTMGISIKLIHYFIMLLLSFAVVASLRTVGVILVVAMLITPASTALLLTDRLKSVIFLSALIGLLSAIIGLVGAIILNTTPGPAMAVVATLIYLLAALLSPKKGLLFRFFRRRNLQYKIRLEDVLKQSIRLHQRKQLTKVNLLDRLEMEKSNLNQYIKTLVEKELMTMTGEQISLTSAGIDEANRLVRAHRLWETFLVDQIGLTEEQIHEEAEKYEHLLTDEILDEVDKELGFPKTDPHGSPIPAKTGTVNEPLWSAEKGSIVKISSKQPNQIIAADLWKIGLLPGTEITIIAKEGPMLKVRHKGKELEISRDLAVKINTGSDPTHFHDPIDQKVH